MCACVGGMERERKRRVLIMPCPHKGDKTLAAHSQHLEMPCQDFPADSKQ